VVIFTTWNDLGEHHYVGPYNHSLWGHDTRTGWQATNGPNEYPHDAYLELSAHFIKWYKLPAGAPEPAILPARESLFYFYNLQPVDNDCPGDPVGPLDKIRTDAAFPLEDAVYVTALLAFNATLRITSGAGSGGAPVAFALAPGRSSVQVPARSGAQRFELLRAGAVLIDVVGSEAINTTQQASEICNSQTFSGSAHF
jgi:hypothetical protein